MKIKKVLIFTFCFMILFSSFSFADSNTYSLSQIYKKHNHCVHVKDIYFYPGNEYVFVSKTPIYYYSDTNSCKNAESSRFTIYTRIKDTDDFVLGGPKSGFVMSSIEEIDFTILGASKDIKYSNSSKVFFSLPVPAPVEELPGMVIPQILIIAGVGILLTSLMLLPGLLRRLWSFL